MVGLEQFRRGVAAYADREIVNRLPTGTLKRVLVGSAVAVALKKGLDNLCGNPIALSLGIISSDKEIDLDLLRDTLLEQIPPEGMAVDVLGLNMTFRAEDIEAVYRCILEA